MAVIQVSGVPAGAPSSITAPLTGRPWADVTLAQTAVPWKPGDQVQVAVQDGPTYTMTVERVGPRGGFARVKLVGGTGGLSREVGAKYYRDIPASTVARELLEECGEAVGEINLPGKLPTWVRAAGPAHEALRALMMRYPERVWQVTPGGKVQIGVPGWPEHDDPLSVESEDAAAGVFVTAFSPKVQPGLHVTLTRGAEEIGKRVTRITHLVEGPSWESPGGSLRTLIGTGDGEDQGVSGLDASVQRAVRWVDYLALFDAEVIRDHGDHTLDLRPLHPLLPEMTRVRLVQPIPGAMVKLRAGGVVLLSFQRGDPSRPLVLHYGTCTLERLELATGRGQLITLDDDRGEVSPEDQLYQRPHIRLQDAAGQVIEMDASTGQINVSANTGVTVKAASTVTVDAATVHVGPGGNVVLAGGGPAVARIGDQIQVVGVMPGSATVTGKIISGSPRVVSG